MRIQSFINGVVIGLLLGVLFAPNSGEETRRRISRKASDLKNTVKDKYDEIADNVSTTINQIKNTANSLLNEEESMYGQPDPWKSDQDITV